MAHLLSPSSKDSDIEALGSEDTGNRFKEKVNPVMHKPFQNHQFFC